MTTNDLDQTEAKAEAADAPKEIRVEDIASVIAVMNRFLSNFSQNPALKNGKVTLADWLVLTMISQKSAGNSKALSKATGVNQQRLKQVLDGLKTAGLVMFGDSGPKETIEVTNQGRARLDEIGEALQPGFADAFKGRERSVTAVERGLKLMLRGAVVKDEQ